MRLLLRSLILLIASVLLCPAQGLISNPPGAGLQNWQQVCISADGTHIAVPTWQNTYFTSTNTGASWAPQAGSGVRNWVFGGCSSNGLIVYGAVQNGFVYKSTDGGVTWNQLTTPAGSAAWEYVVCSSDGSVVVAMVGSVTQGFVYISTNGGSSWTQQTALLSRTWFGLSISGNGQKIAVSNFLFGGGGNDDGKVYVTTNQGSSWSAVLSPPGGASEAFLAYSRDGSALYAAYNTGAGLVYISTNDGGSWTAITPPTGASWSGIATNANGSVVMTGQFSGGPNYLSTNSGATWSLLPFPNQQWFAASDNGQTLVAVTYGGPINVSTNSGSTWSRR